MSSPDSYEPTCPWEELEGRSLRRGKLLRRRRRAVQASLLLLAVAGVAGLVPWAAPGGGDGSEVKLLQIETPSPSPVMASRPRVDVTARPGPTGTPGVAITLSPVPSPAPLPSTRPRPSLTPSPNAASTAPGRQSSLSYADASGDAGMVAGPSVVSDSRADITRMSFLAGSSDLAIGLETLAAADSAHGYYAELTDPRTSCFLKVNLGTSSSDQGFIVYCDGHAVSSFVTISRTAASGRTLNAVVPWSAFPDQVNPRAGLRTSGRTAGFQPGGEYDLDTASSTALIYRTTS